MLYPAIVTALVVFLTVGGQELFGFTMLGRPIVIAPIIGLLLGDVQTGLVVGASLEAIFMGVVNVGGAQAAEPGLATALATTFAIQFGGGLEVALPIALPLGVIGLQLKTLIYVGIVGPFATKFDRMATDGNAKGIRNLHFGLWAIQWGLYALIPFFGVLVGSEATQAVINKLPDVIINGLSVAGNLLPAVGMAMLLQTLWDNKIAVFFFLGFVLTAYLELPLIATAVLAFIMAFLVAQRDLQVKKIADSGQGHVIVSDSMTDEERENEEFLS